MALAGYDRRIAEGSSPALVMGLMVCVLALPSAMLAYSNKLDNALTGADANLGLGPFATGRVDPHLARALAARPSGSSALFRFTPAGLFTRHDRSVTVAVRVDERTAQAIVVRGPANRGLPFTTPGAPVLHVASTAYSLGLARGSEGFTSAPSNFTLPRDSRRSDMPDLSTYSTAKADNSAAATVARLAPRVLLDERERAGRSPRTLEAVGEQSLDVGGSYRVSRNFDVTAGVRYSQDRDRLKSTSPDGKSDSQAVYVGTQFKF